MVNVGIIGAGRIGKVHVESICTQVKDAKVKMLADPFMNDETAKWAKDMGVEAVTKDYKEILADPEIDAVLICSSTDTHSPISVEAIKAGKHVFCEKDRRYTYHQDHIQRSGAAMCRLCKSIRRNLP